MLVQEIRKVTKNKEKIIFDTGESFVLYSGEVRRLGITGGEEMSSDRYRDIAENILLRRAKLRCLNLLKTCDRTEGQLSDRLKRDGYPEQIIQTALAYVASYHYTDDERYAQNYVRQMSGRKSRKQIEYELMGKGVDRDTVLAAFASDAEEGDGIDPDMEAILALARKRRFDPEKADAQERNRFFRYLAGKGFRYSSIEDALGGGYREDSD